MKAFRFPQAHVFRFFFFLPFFLVALAACVGTGPSPTTRLEVLVAQNSADRKQTEDLNAQIFAAANTDAEPANYVVAEGDLLQVTVFGEDDLSSTVRVSDDGTITLPLIGLITAKGHSVHELEKRIERAYGEKYLQDPHVSIFVKEQQGGKITLLGAVMKPGTYDYFSRRRLLSVLAMAGGLANNAGSTVQIRRKTDDAARPTTYIIDLADMLRTGDEQLNLEINPNDVIFVPEAGTFYVDGAVRKPGVYPLKAATTVREAIAMAGGTTWYSNDVIKLLRRSGDGKTDIVDMKVNSLETANVALRDRDIVFVETNQVKQVIYGLRLSIVGTGVSFTPVEPR